MFIIGIDPGPVVGVAYLWLMTEPNGTKLAGVEVAQVTPGLLPELLTGLEIGRPVVAIERYVVSARAGRAATPSAGIATRRTFTLVDEWATRRNGLSMYTRSASEVKPWATDERLTAAGIEVPTGMRHARDAARHALFCAVKTYGLPDPLSRRAGGA